MKVREPIINLKKNKKTKKPNTAKTIKNKQKPKGWPNERPGIL